VSGGSDLGSSRRLRDEAAARNEVGLFLFQDDDEVDENIMPVKRTLNGDEYRAYRNGHFVLVGHPEVPRFLDLVATCTEFR
jgi:hypothetical protein